MPNETTIYFEIKDGNQSDIQSRLEQFFDFDDDYSGWNGNIFSFSYHSKDIQCFDFCHLSEQIPELKEIMYQNPESGKSGRVIISDDCIQHKIFKDYYGVVLDLYPELNSELCFDEKYLSENYIGIGRFYDSYFPEIYFEG